MVVFNKDPLGIAVTIGVHVLLLFGNIGMIRYVIEYGKHESIWRTFGALLMNFFFIMAVISHVRASLSDPGLMCSYGFLLIVGEWIINWNVETDDKVDMVMTVALFFESIIFGLFVFAIGTGQTLSVLCDRNAIEMRRYGTPKTYPTQTKMALMQGMCGRGSRLLWLIPCLQPRIPDPVPPSKMFSAGIQAV